MVHRRVADQQGFFQGLASGEAGKHGPDRFAGQGRHRPRLGQVVADPAHQVGPEAGLGVEARLDLRDRPRPAIDQLSDQCGGAEVDDGPPSVGRLEWNFRAIVEHGDRPLGNLQHDRPGRLGHASQPPAGLDLLGREDGTHLVRDRDFTGEEADLAAAALGYASARELHPALEEQVAQGLLRSGLESKWPGVHHGRWLLAKAHKAFRFSAGVPRGTSQPAPTI